MRGLIIINLSLLLLFNPLFARQVRDDISLGLSGCLFKDGAQSDYRTAGKGISLDLKYGITDCWEIGMMTGIRSNYPGANLPDGFPWPTRNSETGEVYPYHQWDYDHLSNPYEWIVEDGEVSKTDEEILGLSFEKCKNCPQKFIYYPLKFYFQIRGFPKGSFNPYMRAGFEYIRWKVVNKSSGALLQVKDANVEKVEESGDTTLLSHPGGTKNWSDFNGKTLGINYMVGLEFSLSQDIAVDLAIETSPLYGSDFSDAYLDSIFAMGSVSFKITYYYQDLSQLIKESVFSDSSDASDSDFNFPTREFIRKRQSY